jgi:hypothetical protein
MLDLGRLAVFVRAKDADIQVVTGEFEIVGIAAIKGDLFLRRKDEAHVIVPFVAVEMKLSSLIESDHIRAQPGFVARLFLDLGNGVTARSSGIFAGHVRLDGRFHFIRHILDRHQDVELEIGRLDLVLWRFGVEPVPHVIVFFATDLLERIEADVMVRDHEAVGGNKRPASAGVETDARFLEMLEPLRRRLELILFFELLERGIGEEPHSLIRESGGGAS